MANHSGWVIKQENKGTPATPHCMLALTLALFEKSALVPATLRKMAEGRMKQRRLPVVAPVRPNTVSTGRGNGNGTSVKMGLLVVRERRGLWRGPGRSRTD